MNEHEIFVNRIKPKSSAQLEDGKNPSYYKKTNKKEKSEFQKLLEEKQKSKGMEK